jgi:hypothetical protein
MVTKKLILVIPLATLVFAACSGAVSDSQMQTAISEVVMTSQAESPGELATANAAMTQQAVQIATMQQELEFMKTSPTPTITITPWATATITLTPTPRWGNLPSNQRVVAAKGNAPWYRLKGENAAGYPIFVKTNPVQRFNDGQIFWIYKRQYKADGGGYFYKISGPSVGKGYYVRVVDVKEP